jgi:hypothetical protein
MQYKNIDKMGLLHVIQKVNYIVKPNHLKKERLKNEKVYTTATLGYGDFVPSNIQSQIVVIINIIVGYLLLGVGLTIIGRKVLSR